MNVNPDALVGRLAATIGKLTVERDAAHEANAELAAKVGTLTMERDSLLAQVAELHDELAERELAQVAELYDERPMASEVAP